MNDNHFQCQLNEAIDEITSWFLNEYLTKDGCPHYTIDGITGNPVGDRDLLSELDDYAPFFWLLDYQDFITHQIEILKVRLERNPLLFSRPQIRRFHGLGLPHPLRRWIPYTDNQDHVEILYGLLELFELSGNKEFLALARMIFERIIHCFQRKGILCAFRIYPKGPVLPIADAMSGMYIEIAADFGRITEEERYVNIACQWADDWLNSNIFKRYSIFPSIRLLDSIRWIPGLTSYSRKCQLAKSNTSMASGLFALANHPHRKLFAEKALKIWMEGIKKHFFVEGAALAHFPRLSPEEPYGPILSTNFAVIDLLCDMYYFNHEKQYLDFAKELADFFMRNQADETGLFPDEIGKDRSYLDANTDLAVSLKKLAELTNDDRYEAAGSLAVKGILKHHRCRYGYYRDVHCKSGSVLNPIIETRFVSLLLKTLILYRDNYTIYGEKGKWSWFRDR